MRLNNILKILRLGEGLQVEFKVKIPKLNRLARTFSAFSNSAGGTVFFGVDDEGKISPLENPKGTIELANQVAQFYCNPPIEIQTECIETAPGKEILMVKVNESDDKPVHAVDVNNPKDSWPFFRSDKENLPMDRKSLRNMRKTRAVDLTEEFDKLERHEKQIVESLNRQPRQTVFQLSRGLNIGSQRTKKIVVALEKNGWVHSFFNETRREYSLAVPWKKK